MGHNRLARELSPYLRQHAHNPVDWYAWGDEALERARTEDKPILLSIGYSACHWCHVMERESFDDPDIARLMNELFVNIKVDREERPDLDQVYQTVVQVMGQNGGWPLTVFLMPDRRPFYAGTYFPPVDRHGMPGFPTVLRAVHQAYRDRRDDVERSATEITEVVTRATSATAEPSDAPADFLTDVAKKLASRFDDREGGFGSAPKFPNTMALDVLLRAAKRHGDGESLARVRKALDGMRSGGIWDQIGYGFHRYATDARWRIPHFEKMLYDNALLARLYADAWRVTCEPGYAATARETLEYVLREMRSPDGGFYSSQDADSEGEEGKFFVWTPEELIAALGEDDARVATLYWGVAPGGNFEHGATVLHVTRTPKALAAQLARAEADVAQALVRSREKLFAVREQREKPFRDEKTIASWNGLMIGAFADVGMALGEARFVEVAREALAFVERSLWKDGVLLRIYKDGQSKIEGFLEDYADVANAALDVWEATCDAGALAFAETLVRAACERFWDPKDGGFFFAGDGAKDLVVRTKDVWDHAVPSGASSMCHALLRLHALTDEAVWLEKAEATMKPVVPLALEAPLGFGHMLGAIDRWVHGPTEIIVVGHAGDAGAKALLDEARAAYVPNRVLALVDPSTSGDKGPASRLDGQRQQNGAATAYVCANRTCSMPVSTAEGLRALLVG